MPDRAPNPLLMSLLVLEMILFGTVAWLGKVVVDSSLLPWMVTIHVMVAIAVVSAAIAVRHLVAGRPPVPVTRSIRGHLAATLVLGLAQIAVGTQVRELVDHLPAGACCDGTLEESLGGILIWHRVGALLVAALAAAAWWRLRRLPAAVSAAPVMVFLTGFIVLCGYLTGVLLVRLQLPAWLQPAHLVLAFVFHGVMLHLLLRTRLQSAPSSPSVFPV